MALPNDFLQQINRLIPTEYVAFLSALDSPSPISVRFNTNKTTEPINLKPVPWCSKAGYLDERAHFTFDPLFHAGTYYVQEASSMFLGEVIRQTIVEKSRVLDLCAAPGGKSTHLTDALPDGSLLVSNEIIRNRANILCENIIKWGGTYNMVTNNTPADFCTLPHFFDAIVVDAPCSGEGMFRKDPASVDEWSLANVKLCAHRQQEILSAMWDSLRPGGILIYSTCTYNTEENEGNVRFIAEELKGEVIPIDVPQDWQITPALTGNYPCYRFFPHKTTGEGFFMAVIRKEEGEVIRIHSKRKEKGKKEESTPPTCLKEWLKPDTNFTFTTINQSWFAFPEEYQDELMLLRRELNIMQSGIKMGIMKGKDLIPDQSLALSQALNREAFEVYEADWKTAISFLKCEALTLPDEYSRGFVLITYKNQALGWVKNIGNRANNLYPQEWRIRSSHIPENRISVFGVE